MFVKERESERFMYFLALFLIWCVWGIGFDVRGRFDPEWLLYGGLHIYGLCFICVINFCMVTLFDATVRSG